MIPLSAWPFAYKMAAVAIGAALVGGGVTAAVVTSGSEPGVQTYLCSGTSTDLLLQWRQNSTDLGGTYEQAQLTGTAPQEQVSSSQGGLSGTLDGQAVTMSIGFGQPLYGKLTSGTLTLNIPQSDGTIQAASCSQSTVAGWNKTVATLDNQANTDNTAANQAAAQAAHDQAVTKAQASLATDVPQLAKDASALDSDKSLGQAITSMQTDYGTEQKDYQAEQADACGNLGSDSATVSSDNATVSSDNASEQSAAGSVGSGVSGVQNDLSAVQGDLSTLQNLGATPATDASAALKAGQTAVGDANAAISWANGQAQTLNNEGTQLATTAGNYASQHGC